MKYCQQCGNEMVDEAEMCVECGVRSQSSTDTQQQNSIERTEHWKHVKHSFVVGFGAYFLAIFSLAAGSSELFLLFSLIVFGAYGFWCYSIYQDAEWIRENHSWQPNSELYAIVSFFITLVGLYYMFKRHKYTVA